MVGSELDVEWIKLALGIEGTEKDDRIATILPEVLAYLEDYVGWNDLTAAKMVEYNLNHKAGYTSESLSRHSQGFESDYPRSITKGLRRKL